MELSWLSNLNYNKMKAGKSKKCCPCTRWIVMKLYYTVFACKGGEENADCFIYIDYTFTKNSLSDSIIFILELKFIGSFN